MNRSDKISDHFTWNDVVQSYTAARLGIDNTPPADLMPNIRRTGTALESIRFILGGRPIYVASWYRSPPVNKAVHGSASSAHVLGLASDFTCPLFGTPEKVARELAESNLDFDQLIYEFGEWVHVGLAVGARREILTATRDKHTGETIYLPGIQHIEGYT